MAPKPQPLSEQITTLRAEIDAFIDERAATIKETCEGVPEVVIRQLLTARAEGCQCRAYLQIKKQDDEEAARESAA
jgi:hypothetical protein